MKEEIKQWKNWLFKDIGLMLIPISAVIFVIIGSILVLGFHIYFLPENPFVDILFIVLGSLMIYAFISMLCLYLLFVKPFNPR